MGTPKSQRVIQNALKLQAQVPLIPHKRFFWLDKTLPAPPLARSFSCAYEVAQSLHENNMSHELSFCIKRMKVDTI